VNMSEATQQAQDKIDLLNRKHGFRLVPAHYVKEMEKILRELYEKGRKRGQNDAGMW